MRRLKVRITFAVEMPDNVGRQETQEKVEALVDYGTVRDAMMEAGIMGPYRHGPVEVWEG
jgi:hypothetical protein